MGQPLNNYWSDIKHPVYFDRMAGMNKVMHVAYAKLPLVHDQKQRFSFGKREKILKRREKIKVQNMNYRRALHFTNKLNFINPTP
jgi:hypothetical protein